MSEETSKSAAGRVTVNLSMPTYRLLRSFKAFLEWIRGQPVSMDEATRFAVLNANYEAEREAGLTKEDFAVWGKTQIAKVSGDLTAAQVKVILEDVEALGIR